jgi:hypothetical protein
VLAPSPRRGCPTGRFGTDDRPLFKGPIGATSTRSMTWRLGKIDSTGLFVCGGGYIITGSFHGDWIARLMVAIAIFKVLHLRIAPSSYRAKENSELTVNSTTSMRDNMRTYAEGDRGSEGLPGEGGRGFASGRDYLGDVVLTFFLTRLQKGAQLVPKCGRRYEKNWERSIRKPSHKFFHPSLYHSRLQNLPQIPLRI